MSKVVFNIKNVHYAVLNNGTYGTPVALAGAVSFSADPTGDDNIFYADGVEYWKDAAGNGYEGELELAMIPDSFRTEILGDVMDTKNVLVETDNAVTKPFALGFQIDGDGGASYYFWYYNCTASRPSQEANTNEENKDPDTQTLEWTCAPAADGYVRAKTTDTTASADISAWFESVYAPSISSNNG